MRKACFLMGLLAMSACVNTGITPTSRDGVPGAVLDRIPASTPPEEIRQGRVDGCYWYLRHGPLETLWVPVRDAESVPVCL